LRVVSNAIWLSTCRIVADLLSFLLFAVIARSFGPAGSGEYSYAFAIGNLIALVATSGFEEYGIRQYVSSAPADRPRLWSRIITTQVAQLALGAALLAGVLLFDRDLPAARSIVIELSIFMIGWGLARTLFIPAMAAQSMLAPAFTDLGCRLSAIVLASVMLLVTHLPLALALSAFPFAGLTMAAIALANARRHGASFVFRSSLRDVFATLRGTAPFAGSDILNQFYARTDLLLIAYLLGDAAVGLYAADVKFVEVGLVPLIFVGTAVYPMLTRYAVEQPSRFEAGARELVRAVLFLSGWLAVGICCVVRPLIELTFGPSFDAAAPLLPWFALFALVKGAEVVLYRLLYSIRRQNRYVASLLFGTTVIAILNFALIPVWGVRGAVSAAILSTIAVDLICLHGLRQHLRTRVFLDAAARVAVALTATAGCYKIAGMIGLAPWPRALLAAGAFPCVGWMLQLVPDIKHGHLFGRHAESR
jgi:O-antigen/teichoic acid export membrane protein